MKNHKFKKILAISLMVLLSWTFSLKAQETSPIADDTLNQIQDLNRQIEAKKKEADNIQDDINSYRQQIDKLQSQADSLKNRLNLLDAGINRTKKEIKLSQLQIEETQLEIEDLSKQIKNKESEISRKKEEIKELLQKVNNLDDDYVSSNEDRGNSIIDLLVKFTKIIVKYDSWAVYASTLDNSKKINRSLAEKKKNLESLKSSLEDAKEQQEDKQQNLEKHKTNLEEKKIVLAEEQKSKEILLDETKANEANYQTLLRQAVEREQALASQITHLEAALLERLRSLNKDNPFATMIWPVPKNVITTQYGGPGYLQTVHNAIDIRATAGIPVVAPANGIVVASVTRNGDACRARRVYCDYTYVKIAHTEEITSLLLHLSSVTVAEGEEVKVGDIIGYAGGTPRAPGTGYFIYPSIPASTGPHLHFAVIKNGTPINPLNYLP